MTKIVLFTKFGGWLTKRLARGTGVHGGLAVIDVVDGASPPLVAAIDIPVTGVKAKKRIDAPAVTEWIHGHQPQRVYRTWPGCAAAGASPSPASALNQNIKDQTNVKKFTRQKSGNAPTTDINLDFGAAAAKVARVFEPGEYSLRIESARIIQSNNQNVLVALDLIEAESDRRVDSQPLWVSGPNAGAGPLVMENRHLVAQLLTLAGLPTAGDVVCLIPQLASLKFDARLVLAIDRRSGRTYNALAKIYVDDAP